MKISIRYMNLVSLSLLFPLRGHAMQPADQTARSVYSSSSQPTRMAGHNNPYTPPQQNNAQPPVNIEAAQENKYKSLTKCLKYLGYCCCSEKCCDNAPGDSRKPCSCWISDAKCCAKECTARCKPDLSEN